MDDWPPQVAINQQCFHSLVPGSGQRQQEGHTVDLPSESMAEVKSNDFSPTGHLVGPPLAGSDRDGSNRSRRFLPLAATGETPLQRAVPG